MNQVEVKGQKVWCDGCTWTWRPLMPSEQHHVARASIHGLAHQGLYSMCRLMSNKLMWLGLVTDCRELYKCTSCNKAMVTKQETTAVEKMAMATFFAPVQ